jgi:hypothetical protein
MLLLVVESDVRKAENLISLKPKVGWVVEVLFQNP